MKSLSFDSCDSLTYVRTSPAIMGFFELCKVHLVSPGFPSGSGAGEGSGWDGSSSLEGAELVCRASTASLCAALILLVSRSGTHTGTSSEQSYRNKTQHQVLGNLFRKSKSLL